MLNPVAGIVVLTCCEAYRTNGARSVVREPDSRQTAP